MSLVPSRLLDTVVCQLPHRRGMTGTKSQVATSFEGTWPRESPWASLVGDQWRSEDGRPSYERLLVLVDQGASGESFALNAPGRYGCRVAGFGASRASQPHLEDSSVYRPLWPTKLDKIKNLHAEIHTGAVDIPSWRGDVAFPNWGGVSRRPAHRERGHPGFRVSQQTRPPFPGLLSAPKLLLIRPGIEKVVRPNAVFVN